MSHRLHRLRNSRRARNLTLGTLGVLTLGSCGGAALATYVVSESNIALYRDRESWRSTAAYPAPPPEWVAQAAVEFSDAGFQPNSAEGYSDAAY